MVSLCGQCESDGQGHDTDKSSAGHAEVPRQSLFHWRGEAERTPSTTLDAKALLSDDLRTLVWPLR